MNNSSRWKIPPRFAGPPLVSSGQKWHVVQHKKFPQKLNITQKRMMQRQKAMEKRKLPKEMPQGKPKEVENLREEVMPTLKKTKFGRKTTEDDESSCGSTKEITKEVDVGTILIGTILISLKFSIISLTLLDFFMSKEMEESPVEVEKEHSPADVKHSQRVITIDSAKGRKA